jgi:hypothetical protein
VGSGASLDFAIFLPQGLGNAKDPFFSDRLNWPIGSSLFLILGFFSNLGLLLWLPVIAMGSLVTLGYSVYYGYNALGLFVFVGVNVGVAIFWNKSRKHHRMDAFDDRLSFERMEQARDWWVGRGEPAGEEE